MKRLHFGLVMMVGWLVFAGTAAVAAAQEREASIVLRFNSGKAYPGKAHKDRLRQFFQRYETGPRSRVFVVGYTDSVGDKRRNSRLSRERAQATRREIISAFGLEGAAVMAMGKGEEHPVGDNRKASGRAANRRVEIYLANAKVRKPKRVYGPGDPYLPQIETLVGEARTLIMQRRLGEAVRILKKAGGLGGDHYTDWHAAYGIAGFYANAPAAEITAHLATALQLDPYNDIAREYLARMTARQNVARGNVTPHMGDSPATAIPVGALAEQHEYLRLFKVEPVARRQVGAMPVDEWVCVDAQGDQVTYYFDHSRVYGWAFDKSSAAKTVTLPKRSSEPTAPQSAAPVSSAKSVTVSSIAENPKEIWNSKYFK